MSYRYKDQSRQFYAKTLFNFLTVTVIGHIPFHLANTKNRTGIVTHFISKSTNQGSVEVFGEAVNRGGGLGMEIPCVYIFDDARKHAWIYLNNY